MSPITIWQESLESFRGFVASLDDWSAKSPCPGWSIADLLSHTIDLESMLAGDPRPDYEPNWQALPHISSDFGRLTEVGVDMRRSWTREALLDDLDMSHQRALDRIAALGPEGVIPWLRGDTPVPQLLGLRAFDIWVHEQDARFASSQPGNYAGPGAENARDIFVGALPRLWAKSVGAPRGATLHFLIDEPGMVKECWIRVGDDGKASFVEAETANVSIALPWPSFVLLAGGRHVDSQTRDTVRVTGDTSLGHRLVDSLAVTP